MIKEPSIIYSKLCRISAAEWFFDEFEGVEYKEVELEQLEGGNKAGRVYKHKGGL